MGGGLLSEPAKLPKTYTETFNDLFPSYLAIGMSSREYWDGDPFLAQYYRKAFKLRQEEDDNRAWLQGMYFYEALSVALSNSFRKEGTPAKKYSSEPYSQQQKRKQTEEYKQAELDRAEMWMNSLVPKSKKTDDNESAQSE